MNITLEPVGEKTRSIASQKGAKKPDELDDLMLGSIVSQIGKCICIMGGRMPFAPTNVILRCTNTSVILKILKILIQNEIIGDIPKKPPRP